MIDGVLLDKQLADGSLNMERDVFNGVDKTLPLATGEIDSILSNFRRQIYDRFAPEPADRQALALLAAGSGYVNVLEALHRDDVDVNVGGQALAVAARYNQVNVIDVLFQAYAQNVAKTEDVTMNLTGRFQKSLAASQIERAANKLSDPYRNARFPNVDLVILQRFNLVHSDNHVFKNFLSQWVKYGRQAAVEAAKNGHGDFIVGLTKMNVDIADGERGSLYKRFWLFNDASFRNICLTKIAAERDDGALVKTLNGLGLPVAGLCRDAVEQDKPNVVRALSELGVNIREIDEEGGNQAEGARFALIAAQNNSPEMIYALYDAGVDMNAVNRYDRNAVDYAHWQMHKEAGAALKDCGAQPSPQAVAFQNAM